MKENTCKLCEIAKDQFKELKSIIADFKGSFEELYIKLNGFNYVKDERFDANYGVLTITVDNNNNKYELYKRVDIWDDEKQQPIYEGKEISII